MTPVGGPQADPATAEVVTSRLYSICSEGMEAARQVSASPVVYAIGDVQTAILTPEGIPVVGSGGSGGVTFRQPIAETIARCTDNPGINPGDMFVLNDPWCGARHQSDVMVVGPVHHKERLVGWVGSLCHHLDVGAMTPGGWIPGATEVYQEGIRLPPVKLIERGELRQDIFSALMNMVRSPEKVALDYRGQIAANNVMKSKFVAVCERYGYETVSLILQNNVRRTRARLAERFRQLPSGRFSETVFLEFNNGVHRELLKCVVTIIKRDDELIVDFDGSSSQRQGPTNAALVNAEYWVIPMYLRATVGQDTPFNMGVREAFELRTPPGSIVDPLPPAPVSAGVSVSGGAVQGAMNKLLLCSEAFRARASGCYWTFASNMVMMAGTGLHEERFTYTLMDGSHGMGAGARSYADGVDVGGSPLPELSLVNVEFHEVDNPLLFVYRRRATDTGGPGQYRGGVGIEEKWTPHGTEAPLNITVSAYSNEGPTTLGASGGLPGALTRAYLVRGASAGDHSTADQGSPGTDRLPAAATGIALREGECLAIGCVGGGGYGDPLERDPDRVLVDVLTGAVSFSAANQIYGVVIDGEEVDRPATEARRHAARALRLDAARVPKRSTAESVQSARPLLTIGEWLQLTADRRVRCTRCGFVYCDATLNHKEFAAIEETSLPDGNPILIDVPELVMRRYYCPSCAVQFWVDIAERDSSVSFDVQLELDELFPPA